MRQEGEEGEGGGIDGNRIPHLPTGFKKIEYKVKEVNLN